MDKYKCTKKLTLRYPLSHSIIATKTPSIYFDLPKQYIQKDTIPDLQINCGEDISKKLSEYSAPNSIPVTKRDLINHCVMPDIQSSEQTETTVENQTENSTSNISVTPSQSMEDIIRSPDTKLREPKKSNSTIQLKSKITDYFTVLKSDGTDSNTDIVIQNVIDTKSSFFPNSNISPPQTEESLNTTQRLGLRTKLEKAGSTSTRKKLVSSTSSCSNDVVANESLGTDSKTSSVLKRKKNSTAKKTGTSKKRRANEGQDNTETSSRKSKKTTETPHMQIIVKKAATLIGNENEKVPTYNTTSADKRGNVLLINNISFNGDKRRKGSEVDVWNIKNLFDNLGFDIQDHADLTKEDMENIIESYSKDPILETGDIQVVIIMSHGNSKKETYIQTIDEKTVEIEWIVNQFSNTTCPNLAAKPKIFIFQCCRGNYENQEKTDSHITYSKSWRQRAKSDVLLAFATVRNYVSYRSDSLGSRFIRAICEVFPEHAHDTNIVDLLTMVDNRINLQWDSRNFQTCCIELRGFKKCYLNPIDKK